MQDTLQLPKLTDEQGRALRLVDGGTRMRLTHLGNTIVSRHAERLLALGLIKYAPERWIAYEPTSAGKEWIKANPRSEP